MTGDALSNAAGAQAEAHASRRAFFVILAAGKGTRMRSEHPKVLHQVAGAPMLGHVLALAGGGAADRAVVVVGHASEAVAAAAAAAAPREVTVETVEQKQQLGTAHALRQAEAALVDAAAPGEDADVFMLYGDTPLIRRDTLRRMAAARAAGAGVVVLGFEAADPTGYGRLILDAEGNLQRIVEEKDATDAERSVTFCNSGVMAFCARRLWPWLARVRDDNAKREFYVTDVIALARADGVEVAVAAAAEDEVLGVNDRVGLAAAEAAFQRRARVAAMRDGATLTAPETVFFAHDTRLGTDVTVGPNVVFGPGVVVGAGASIGAFSHLEACRIGPNASVGPFARLRGGCDVGAGAKIGNFVEMKNVAFGDGAKASHLSYLGDASVGPQTNIGAGVITCNYDGFSKHRTEIGADAFIGSNAALVAPVEIGDRAIVAAGSTVTEDAPADALALARARQTTKPGHAARLKDIRETAAAARRAVAKRRGDGATEA